MEEIVSKHNHEGYVAVCFNIEADEVMAIGEKMEFIHEMAYMNGYYWDAFLNCYLQIHDPAIVDGIESDTEAGTYVALFEEENAAQADRLIKVITELVKHPDTIYVFLQEHGDDIEWD